MAAATTGRHFCVTYFVTTKKGLDFVRRRWHQAANIFVALGVAHRTLRPNLYSDAHRYCNCTCKAVLPDAGDWRVIGESCFVNVNIIVEVFI